MSNIRKMIGMNSEELAELNHALSPNYIDSDGTISLWQAINQTATFIVGCYTLEINPLPFLRVICPEYTWQYIELYDKKTWDDISAGIIELATTSDFFWMAGKYCDECRWVTARRKGLTLPRKIFGNGKLEEMLSINSNGDGKAMITSLKKKGIQEIESVSNELISLL